MKADAPKSLAITVLLGGPSTERHVSLVSGAAVAAALRRLGHTVAERDISPADLSALDLPADLVFPVLHGSFGEDGQVQTLLEARGINYVGCDAACSRLGINKMACKAAWRDAGLPTADAELVTADTIAPVLKTWRMPAVVKPIDQGSSVGVTLPDTAAEFEAALRAGVERFGRMMVETRLTGPELTVGIVDSTPLPIIQIVPAAEFYDFEAKYTRDDTEYRFDVDVDAPTYRQIQHDSLRALQAIGGRDYARVDWILDQDLGPQLLEVNTIPGFTSHSLLPKAAAYIGMSFDALVDRLVQLALRRSAVAER